MKIILLKQYHKYIFKTSSVVLFSIIFFTSCLKEELPVKPFDRGNVITDQVSMANDYRYQVWYKLSTKQIVKTNLRTDWDLAFSCNDSNIVLLNTSLVAQAADAHTNNFNAITNDIGLEYSIDHPSLIPDSIALKNFTQGNVFIIDRGYTPAGNAIGKKKIQLISVNSNQYIIKYADLNGENEHTINIPKNNLYNFIYFSFNSHQVLNIEPPKGNWDLCFTSYTHIFYNPYMPYLVTGVLINSNEVIASDYHNKDFADIQIHDIKDIPFYSHRDVIGYDWKDYNLNSGKFEIDFSKNYIIKDDEGFYYKLRFTGFYDSNGIKGNPKFEFQKL